MIGEILSILAPVGIAVGVGVIWGRCRVPFDVPLVTALVMMVGAPALVFHTLANLPVDPAALARMAAATVTTMVASAAVGWVTLRALRLPIRTFLPVLMFPNTGNLGLPLSFLAFGAPGLALAVGVFALYLVAQFTVGIAISSGRLAGRDLIRMPLLWVLPPSLLCLILSIQPPAWLSASAELLGGMTIPLMLLALGVSLSRLRLVGWQRSLLLAGLRLGLGYGLAAITASVLALDPLSRGVLIVQSSMPTAVFNYLFAMRYDTHPEAVAASVSASTVLTLFALPLVLLDVLR